MPCLQDSAVLSPSTIRHYQAHDHSSKVTERLWPGKQDIIQGNDQNREFEWTQPEHSQHVSQQRTKHHRKYGSSSVGLIRPLVRLVREPVKTLGQLYAESEWVFDDGKRLEHAHKRETEKLYSKLKQVSQFMLMRS